MSELLYITNSEINKRIDEAEDKVYKRFYSNNVVIKGTFFDVTLTIADKCYVSQFDRAMLTDKKGNVKAIVDCPGVLYIYDLINTAKRLEYLKIKGIKNDLAFTLYREFDKKIIDIKEGIKQGSKKDTLELKGKFYSVKVKVDIGVRIGRYKVEITKNENNVVFKKSIDNKYELVDFYRNLRDEEIRKLDEVGYEPLY